MKRSMSAGSRRPSSSPRHPRGDKEPSFGPFLTPALLDHLALKSAHFRSTQVPRREGNRQDMPEGFGHMHTSRVVQDQIGSETVLALPTISRRNAVTSCSHKIEHCFYTMQPHLPRRKCLPAWAGSSPGSCAGRDPKGRAGHRGRGE